MQDILPILGCFWCFGCYFSWKPFFWPNVLYMVRKLLMWGLIWCIEHSISIISQRLWIAWTRWDNFDSCTSTLVLRKTKSMRHLTSRDAGKSHNDQLTSAIMAVRVLEIEWEVNGPNQTTWYKSKFKTLYISEVSFRQCSKSLPIPDIAWDWP